jgi:diguanylate cyclase (GGDEF)-like protein/PAS domain S-box-containing protein
MTNKGVTSPPWEVDLFEAAYLGTGGLSTRGNAGSFGPTGVFPVGAFLLCGYRRVSESEMERWFPGAYVSMSGIRGAPPHAADGDGIRARSHRPSSSPSAGMAVAEGPAGEGRADRVHALALAAPQRASVMVFDTDLRCVIVRGGALGGQEFNPAELEGCLVADVVDAERFRCYEPLYRAALAGETTTTEVQASQGDRMYLLEVAPLRDADGRVFGGVSVALDITEQTQAQRWLGAVVDNAPDAIVIVDPSGTIVLVNTQTEAMFGYDRADLVGKPVELLVPAYLRSAHHAHRATFAAAAHPRLMGVGLELLACRHDGTTFPVEISLSPLKPGDTSLVCAAIRDVTERTRLQEEVAYLAAVVEDSHDAIIGKNLDGTIVSWNRGAQKLYGYSAEEAVGQTMSILVPPGYDDEIPAILRSVGFGARVEDHETVRVRKDGTHVDVSLTISPIRDRHGQIVGASTIARDVTERRRHREQLQNLADHDALTGARNRRRFDQDLSSQIARCRRYGEFATMLSIDLDGLKQINDTYGHMAGDDALRKVVVAIRQRLRTTDLLARVGGDEFAVLLPHTREQPGTLIAQQLRRVIEECTIDIPGGRLPLRASIGIAVIDDHADSDSVLAAADAALYRDKANARGRDPA